MKKSWSVLRQDKKLMLFPVMSSLASLAVLVSFAVPIWLAIGSGSTHSTVTSTASGAGYPVWVYPLAVAFYFVTAFVTIYFNAGLVGAAMIRLRGGNPTLGDGFHVANSHLGKILGWAAVTATVGIVLRFIQERAGILGTIVAGIGGIAWQLVTYFVVPVLLFEDLGPFGAVKRSARIFKDRWGEQVAGNYGIGLAAVVFGLIAVPFFVAGAWLVGVGMAPVGALLLGVAVAYVICLGILTSALQGVYNTALYRFATDGEGSGVFSADELAHTFRPKKGPVPVGWGHGSGPPAPNPQIPLQP
ncbi:MAG: hypothetical protein IT198_05110 [Acidimicrobiia bacterium]|nr:hypothetical protein [Acidimicrobiia bacterium]